jgi:prepilin-type N-terminal cleavage/methylation domain-containing protein
MRKDIPVKRKIFKNAGFTLLEMIVVVAIMAIGLGLVSMSVNTIFSLEMKRCVKEITSELGKEKVTAMTRAGNVYMRLYKTGDGIHIDKYENDKRIETIDVGSAKIAITCHIGSDPTGTPLDADGIIIAFNRNNGSFKTVGQAWALYDESAPGSGITGYYTKIVVRSGSSRTIVLWPDTGKFSVSG